MSDPSKGKHRRGSQRQPPPTSPRAAGTQPVGGAATTTRMPGVPWLVAIAIIVIVVGVAGGILLAFGILVPRPGGTTVGAAPSSSPAASSGGSAAAGTCPTSQPSALSSGTSRTVTLTTPKGTMAIKIEADLSPIAAGNFVALASCGFYDRTVFHRTPTLQDGTPFVIQGGDPEGTGTGGPGYTIKDEPVTTPYKRGTVAMARTGAPDSVGSQFFVVLDDKDGDILGQANTYQIIGYVTAGMETADAIFAASAGVELPPNPIPITTATVASP